MWEEKKKKPTLNTLTHQWPFLASYSIHFIRYSGHTFFAQVLRL